LSRALRKAGPDQSHLQEDGAVLRGLHGARQFKTLRREMAIRIAAIHGAKNPFQALNAENSARFLKPWKSDSFCRWSGGGSVQEMNVRD
jgi:hypothetical protein